MVGEWSQNKNGNVKYLLCYIHVTEKILIRPLEDKADQIFHFLQCWLQHAVAQN